MTESVKGHSTDTIKNSLLIVGAQGDTGKTLLRGLLEWVFASDLVGKDDKEKGDFLVSETNRAELRGKIKALALSVDSHIALAGAKSSLKKQKEQCEVDLQAEHQTGPAWTAGYNDFLRRKEKAGPDLEKGLGRGDQLAGLANYTF